MKLIEQYLCAIGRKLPYRGRNDIKAELESLIMDDIEAKYGTSPTEDEVKERLKAFGSPTAVARRYREDKPVIATGLSQMYFFLLKILAGALAIAYFVIFALSLFQGDHTAKAILASFGKSVAGLATGYLCAVGAVSLAFIAATRAKADPKIDLEAEWDPDDLKDIELEEPRPSKADSIVTLVCLREVGWGAMVRAVEGHMGGRGFDPVGDLGAGFILWQVLLWIALMTVWQTVAMRAFSAASRPRERSTRCCASEESIWSNFASMVLRRVNSPLISLTCCNSPGMFPSTEARRSSRV